MAQDILADGFVNLCISTSLNFYDGKCRLLVEGQYVPNGALAVPIVPDQIMQVTSPTLVDSLFTPGSVLAEGLKTIFKMCPSNIAVYALPRLDAGYGVAAYNSGTVYTSGQSMKYSDGYIWKATTTTTAGDTPVSAPSKWSQVILAGVKAVYTMTITGPATSDGTIDIFMGADAYSTNGVIVSNTDTAQVVAQNIINALPANFPYVPVLGGTTNSATITFTAVNAGQVGNHFNPVVNWKGFQNYFPTGITIATVSTTAGANNPAPVASYSNIIGTCCYNVYALLSGDKTWQRALRNWIRSAWDCTKPQCFGAGYCYNYGSLGQVLAAGDNSPELQRVAVPVNDVNYPWQLVAGYAALSACSACTSPELSIQGRQYGVINAIERPTSCVTPWSYSDMTALQAAGFVTYTPLAGGLGQYTYPYIENDVTNFLYDELNRPNVTYRDASSRRLAANTALALATKLQEFSGLGNYTANTRIPQGIFGTNKNLILGSITQWAQSQVGILFSNFDNVQTDIVLQEDFEVQPPCQGVPCKYHLRFRYRPPCRVANFQVNMLPAYLSNCNR